MAGNEESVSKLIQQAALAMKMWPSSQTHDAYSLQSQQRTASAPIAIAAKPRASSAPAIMTFFSPYQQIAHAESCEAQRQMEAGLAQAQAQAQAKSNILPKTPETPMYTEEPGSASNTHPARPARRVRSKSEPNTKQYIDLKNAEVNIKRFKEKADYRKKPVEVFTMDDEALAPGMGI